MDIEVRYYSRGGNTKKVADAVAKAAGVEAKDVSAPIEGVADLLFLGGSVYGARLDAQLKQFIDRLDPATVKSVALFGTSAIVKKGNSDMEKLLREKGIKVLGQSFHCWGSFTALHRGHPDGKDLEQAAAFARGAMT